MHQVERAKGLTCGRRPVLTGSHKFLIKINSQERMTCLTACYSSFGFSGSMFYRVIFVWASLFALTACQARSIPTPDRSSIQVATSLSTSTFKVIPSPEPPFPATITINPTGHTLIATHTPLEEPLNLVNPKVVVLAENLSNSDDLVLAPDGSIYISDIKDGSILQYSVEGIINTIIKGLDEHTSSDITLIIPDSPHGVILRLSLDGKTISEIAHGFSRPTAAWVEKDGSILVVDENTHSLSRIHPDGSIQLLAQNLPTPDDVIEDNSGHIFVNTLTDGAIHVLSEDGRPDSPLASHLASPQGEIFDSDGNLVVTDSGNGRLLKILIH
jgi:sugar lactone lactonase YvrE